LESFAASIVSGAVTHFDVRSKSVLFFLVVCKKQCEFVLRSVAMVKVMRVDVAPLWQFVVASVISGVVLLLALIIGATGPKILEGVIYYAYNCKNESHTYNATLCNGTQLSTGAWSNMMSINVTPLNKYWFLVVTPYNTKTQQVNQNVRIEVEMHVNWDPVTNKPANNTYLIRNETVITDIVCLKGQSRCLSFLLILEDNIAYPTYYVRVRFIGLTPQSFLGDVQFQFLKLSVGYSRLALGLRITLLLYSVGLLVFYTVFIRQLNLSEDQLTWEQKMMIALAIGLILYNNPLFAVEYLTSGWFIVFLSALSELLFTCVLFLFWFFILDKLRLESDSEELELRYADIPKLLGVLLYGMLAIIFYAYTSIRERLTPLFSVPDHITPIQVVFYLIAVLYVCLVLWIASLIVLTAPLAFNRQKSRFLFFAVPTLFLIVSVVIGIFTGTVGPFGRNTIGMVYYSVLYNVYVTVLLWGFGPTEVRFRASNPSETTRILFDERKEPKK